MSGCWRRSARTWAPVLALTALAGGLRLLGLGSIPPGLYRDEAWNGLDALGLLRGSFPIYFEANHGREPLFIYLMAATVGSCGRTPAAVRLAAAMCGTLTVPATYLMARAWFNRRTALLSAALLSVTVWHIQLSRVGFRAVVLPLTIAVFLWSAAHALRSRRAGAWLLTGILYGLLFYTYVAARFTPVALLGLVTYLLVAGRTDSLWPGALYFGIGVLLALIPLGTYAACHWEIVMGRPTQVSLLNPLVNQGDPWGTFGRHVVRTLGMFFVRGDPIPRHNVPGRPVFSPLMGAAMVVGIVRAAVGAGRRDVGSALILAWVTTMLGPTLAAADAPHFLRAVGVLPPLVVLPAIGLETAWHVSAGQFRRLWVPTLLCLALALSLGDSVRDYFVGYGTGSEAAHAFEAAATELAAEINRFTGVGWNGRTMTVPSQLASEERRAYLDMRLWQAWKALPFLVPEQRALVKFHPDALPSPSTTDEMLLLLWPYDDLQPYLAALPHPSRIEAQVGPLTRGDLEEKAYPAYVSYRVGPVQEPPPTPLAVFGEAIELTRVAVEAEGHIWEIHLQWSPRARLDENYTVSVFVCDGQCRGNQLIAQDDAQPGAGYYPTSLWHPGDVVLDVHTLELSSREVVAPKVAVGLYAWPVLERLPVTTESGSFEGDLLTLTEGDWDHDAH